MTDKYLRVTMQDGSKWDIQAKIIAKDRALYYAGSDISEEEIEDFDEVYKEELEYALSNDYEIIDWAANNMNWEDVKDDAVKVSDMKVDYQEGWCNGNKEVIEK